MPAAGPARADEAIGVHSRKFAMRIMRLYQIIGLTAFLALIFVGFWLRLAGAAPQLQAEDCRKCHAGQVEEIQAAGGQHRDAIGCIDCHQEHPPRGANVIPECSLCHEIGGNPHFSSPSCRNCHHPHRPLQVDFTKASWVWPACMTCHPSQGEELQRYPSKHSVLDCKECHQQHGQYLSCLECHDPHMAEQNYADCRQCHKPHMPLKVVYSNSVAVAFCASCHTEPAAQLAVNNTRHHGFLCVYCHKFQHKVIPQCRTCHDEPHFAGLHQAYPECVTCHLGSHNLLN